MKKRICSLLIGAVISLAATGASHAMSKLIFLSIEPEWPATSQPGNVVLYKITAVTRAGQGLLEVALTSEGLPDGTTISFSPSHLRFTGRVPTIQTSIMAVTCPALLPTDTYPFTVTGTAQREFYTATNYFHSDYPINQQPMLFADNMDTGSVRIRGLGTRGQTYNIETTTDLANPAWEPCGFATADGNGRFTFMVDKATPARFFRAVYTVPAAMSSQQ